MVHDLCKDLLRADSEV